MIQVTNGILSDLEKKSFMIKLFYLTQPLKLALRAGLGFFSKWKKVSNRRKMSQIFTKFATNNLIYSNGNH